MGFFNGHSASFDFSVIGITGTKSGLSRDQVFHCEKRQVGTKLGIKWGPSQTGHEGAKRAIYRGVVSLSLNRELVA